MSPRRRKETNRALPPNLRVRDGYYSYRNPEDGAEYGIGRGRRHAIDQAIKANAHLASRKLSLVERLSGSQSWADWCNVFEKILAERDSKPNTRRTRKSQLKRLRGCFQADRAAAKIETKDCAEVLGKLKEAGKHRTAQAFRAFLVDCFDRMVAQGWRKDNPATVLDAVTVKVRRARLSLEVFERLYQTTELVWLRNFMALALISGQGREECCLAQFQDFRDGHWWSERGKTGARVAIPLGLRLEAFGMSLDDVLRQCRTTGIVSRYLIHQTKRAKGAKLGKKMHMDKVTRVFKSELAALGINWGDKKPPTPHEIRSLSARLYKAEGRVNPQELLGHKDPASTAIYTDGRGEWVKVGIRTV